MAGSSSEDSGVGRSLEGMSNGQQRSGEALAEWRSSEQVENGITSTSPPFWDTDDDDECGLKPSELYGKYTWKIDKFSQINKRELRSNAFEVGGYKWYILIYPQGCDVCNHLSLFLCVANHDKLLPGWSHFAQFTIAVVNKDPKKSKYSDTLHRFWKKEHDWGWKKFMELSKVLDGFVDADTLIIKAQVQVIRERADRPFKCLDCQYRRELVRVYLSNVEQICRRFVEERRGRLGKLIEDKARWSSFCSFWLGIDQTTKRRMSREKLDLILKVVVKHFFIEKEVTSTLVMDSLYSGLKALEGQTKSKKDKEKCLTEERPMPIVQVEKDTFILVDDVLLLLERAAMEPLPPKDEKGPQNRTKDGGTGEDFSKDSIERDERRLTELGRRTIEIFVLAHIFSKIEVAYQEAVALKRQEELIREEEAAWMAGNEQKTKRGASVKEKKSKKKQGKQKRNNRKQKDKTREEKPDPAVEDKPPSHSPTKERIGFSIEDVSDVSDSVDRVPEAILQPDSDFRESSPVNWDTDTSEPHPPTESSSSCINGANNAEIKSLSVVDDSSSTCSTDSLASVAMNGRGNSLQNQKIRKSPSRGKVKRGKGTDGVTERTHNVQRETSDVTSEGTHKNDVAVSSKVDEPEPDVVVLSLHDRIKWLEHHVVKKEEEVVSLQKKLNVKDEVVPPRPSKEKSAPIPSSPKPSPIALQYKSDPKKTAGSGPSIAGKPLSDKTQHTDKPLSSSHSPETSLSSKPPYVVKSTPQKPTEKPINGHGPSTTEKPAVHQVSRTVEKPPSQQVHVSTSEKPLARPAPAMSRPLSAPLVPGPRPSGATPVVSMVQTPPSLARSVSAAGRLGPDPSPATQSFVPQSYRNAMMGQSHSPNLTVNLSHPYSQPPQSLTASAPIFLPQSSERVDSNNIIGPRYSFQMPNNDILQNGSQWMNPCGPSLTEIQNFDIFKPANTRSQGNPNGMLADEFPHLDIINDLLDDECGISSASSMFQRFSNGPHRLNRQFSFPGDISGSLDQGPSTSSCGFDEFQLGYVGGSSGGQFDFDFDFSRETTPQQPYVNGHIDGLMQSQWQVGGSDVSYLGSRNMDSDGYPFHMPEYSNLTMGVNSYTVYRPSNGQ